jgi:hypothetical protein
MSLRVRRFSFNIHHWTDLNISLEQLRDLLTNSWKVDYLILGSEQTQDNNIPHIQGYIEYTNATTWEQVRERFISVIGYVSDLQVSKGDAESNYKYCSKTNNFIEYGTYSKQIHIDDIASNVISLLTQGHSLITIMKQNKTYITYIVRNYRNLENIQRSINFTGHLDETLEEGDYPF